MLRRGDYTWGGKFEFAPAKIAAVVRNQMLHATRYCQFQNVVVVRIREVGTPAEVYRLPDGRSAKIVQ